MENIFDIRFSFEQKVKDEVIYKFSNKQGGAFNVFAYHWQCFAWAAVIGFIRGKRRPLTPPIADKPFSLNTMVNTEGERIAHALICLCVARAKSLDIMKDPKEAITMINEYANAGFYHIMKLMKNGENSFNDIEKVKQEIFNRDLNISTNIDEEYEEPDPFDEEINSEELSTIVDEELDETSIKEAEKPWSDIDTERLKLLYDNKFEVSTMAERLGKSIYAIQYQLDKLGLVKMPLNLNIENNPEGSLVYNKAGQVVYSDDAYLKIINDNMYRFNFKSRCLTIKGIDRVDGQWIKGGKKLVAYNESELFSVLTSVSKLDDIEDFFEGDKIESNKIKVKGIWYDYYGDIISD